MENISNEQKKYGYIDYINLRDNNKLINIFNILIEQLYYSLLFFLNQETIDKIYPEIYNALYNSLNNSIDKEICSNIFKFTFPINAESIIVEVLKKYKIDIFSNEYILSKVNFNDTQKFILENAFASIIANKNSGQDIQYKRKNICDKLNISKAKYNIEVLKLMKQFYKLSKIQDENMKLKTIISMHF